MSDINSNINSRPDGLTTVGKLLVYSEGMIIMRPGVEVESIYEVISGFVKVYKLNERKEKSIRIVFGPGDMFPLAWLIDKSPFEVYVKAHSDVRLFAYKKSVFIKLIHNDPDVSFFVMSRLVVQKRIYSACIDTLGYKYASQRLAYHLVHIAGRFGVEKNQEILLPAFTNQDLGSILNLSRECINKELGRFARLGLVKIVGKQVCITNMAGLHSEIGEDSPPTIW